MVGHQQRGATARQVLDTADLDPEPRPEKEPQQRPKDRVVEVRIEPELVDGVVTSHPFADESGDRGDVLGELVEWRIGGPRASRTRRTPMLVDLADDGSDLFGRRAYRSDQKATRDV